MIGRGCDVSRLCDFIFGRCVFQQLFGMAQISMLDTGEHLLGTDSVQPLIQWKHLPAFGFWKVTPNCGCAQLRDHPVYIFWNFIVWVQKSKWQSVDAPKQGQESGLSCDILDPKKCNAVSRYTYVWSGGVYCIIFCDSFVQVFLFCILDPRSDLKWIS